MEWPQFHPWSRAPAIALVLLVAFYAVVPPCCSLILGQQHMLSLPFSWRFSSQQAADPTAARPPTQTQVSQVVTLLAPHGDMMNGHPDAQPSFCLSFDKRGTGDGLPEFSPVPSHYALNPSLADNAGLTTDRPADDTIPEPAFLVLPKRPPIV